MIENKITETIESSSYECSMSVDCAVFGFQENTLKLLLVKRSIAPFKDFWLLPGGLMAEGQTMEESVNKVLYHLTGINDIHHQQIKCYSDVNRHPKKRVVTTCFYALIKPENHPIVPKNHISDIQWHPVNEPLPNLAFDHKQLVEDAIAILKQNLKRKLVFGELLPQFFTLKELQDLYESILNEKFDRRNFRKKMMQMDLLVSTGKKKIGAKGGPELFTLKKI